MASEEFASVKHSFREETSSNVGVGCPQNWSYLVQSPTERAEAAVSDLITNSDEQLRRFREREQIPFKKFKITEEDYRNRERRPDYEVAVREMIARTSTEFAPWQLVPSNDKRWARIQVLETFADALAERLREE